MSRGTYKLIEGIKTPQQIRVILTENGKKTTNIVRLIPGETYQLEDDDNFVNSLRAAITTKPYTDSLVTMLKENGVPYQSVAGCQSCGGRGKRIKYCIIEVKENAT